MPIGLSKAGKGAKKDYLDRHKVARVEMVRPQNEILDPEADVADILVHMADGSVYRGTVTTLQFIQETMDRARDEGGGAEGDYWFGDAIIMDRIDESKLPIIVEDLIDSFMFEKAFRKAEAGSAARAEQ